ncbi:MAG: hypothetical protein LBG80_03945 [Bacteroidales bacterium]|jgi:hypothetical protein|nr:hypothetical protein [Bacteroidales bacterium]
MGKHKRILNEIDKLINSGVLPIHYKYNYLTTIINKKSNTHDNKVNIVKVIDIYYKPLRKE